MLKITEFEDGIRFEIKVQPRASQNQITGVVEGVMKVRLNSPPVDGKANHALINLLAKTLSVPKKNISIIRGETNTSKLIHISGLNTEEFVKRAGLL
jgi:uncharacterized protein (TIGR00251 family)